NNVQNYAIGYYLIFGKLFNTNHGSSLFQANKITATPGTIANYCTYGLALSQGASVVAANTGVPVDAISITTNTITNIGNNCILISSVNTTTATTGFIQVYNNTELSLKYNTALTSLASPPVAAIGLTNARRIRVTYNTNIHTAGLYPVNVSYIPIAQYSAGVYSKSSINNTINCNIITNVGESMVFDGTCTTANNNWQKNNMNYCQFGLVLRNTGILGDQGSATYPIDDTWSSSATFSVDQTLCDATNPGTGVTSILYTQATACSYSPCTNALSGFGSAAYGASTLLTGSGTNTLTCGAAGTG